MYLTAITNHFKVGVCYPPLSIPTWHPWAPLPMPLGNHLIQVGFTQTAALAVLVRTACEHANKFFHGQSFRA